MIGWKFSLSSSWFQFWPVPELLAKKLTIPVIIVKDCLY